MEFPVPYDLGWQKITTFVETTRIPFRENPMVSPCILNKKVSK